MPPRSPFGSGQGAVQGGHTQAGQGDLDEPLEPVDAPRVAHPQEGCQQRAEKRCRHADDERPQNADVLPAGQDEAPQQADRRPDEPER